MITEDRLKQYAYLAVYGILLACLSFGLVFTMVGIIILCNDGADKGMPYFLAGFVALCGGMLVYYMYLRARCAERRLAQQHESMNPVVVVLGIPVAESLGRADRCAV